MCNVTDSQTIIISFELYCVFQLIVLDLYFLCHLVGQTI